MLEELNVKYKDVGLQMNLKKRQVMLNNLADTVDNTQVEGSPPEKKKKCLHLSWTHENGPKQIKRDTKENFVAITSVWKCQYNLQNKKCLSH